MRTMLAMRWPLELLTHAQQMAKPRRQQAFALPDRAGGFLVTANSFGGARLRSYLPAADHDNVFFFTEWRRGSTLDEWIVQRTVQASDTFADEGEFTSHLGDQTPRMRRDSLCRNSRRQSIDLIGWRPRTDGQLLFPATAVAVAERPWDIHHGAAFACRRYLLGVHFGLASAANFPAARAPSSALWCRSEDVSRLLDGTNGQLRCGLAMAAGAIVLKPSRRSRARSPTGGLPTHLALRRPTPVEL